jgi:dihydroxyacetone kinase
MSYLLNDPVEFADELLEGFVAANSALVRAVSGGVVRASRTPAGQVAVVIGGGSGHYPAFAGLVGHGLAHGAAMGNVFASPSAQQIYTVARAAAGDSGVLFSYGNYAGDVLNFDQAQARLVADGIPCRTVVVTDDIFSASDAEIAKRRGIAGDLAVFRVAAWAAEQGRTLDEVHALASLANDRTRSLGVAFSGCTLPGASEPLFTVPAGRMAVGMGIHGEPGIEERDVPTAHDLAELLVTRLLDARPSSVGTDGGSRVALILNGLGSVKYEELFVTYRTVASLLEAEGVTIVDPEVGELVTSFEMAGISLTFLWLDDQLEEAWRSPAYTPAYRKGVVDTVTDARPLEPEAGVEDTIPNSSEESRAAGTIALAAVEAVRDVIEANVAELGRLDSIAGDGDHGIGMQRGATAALAAARRLASAGAGVGSVLSAAGDAWADRAGGTSGALWGLALNAVAQQLGNEAAPTGDRVAAGITAARDSIAEFGKAQPGDKTMLDALTPFVDALTGRLAAGDDLAAAWSAAAEVAQLAADSTAALLPKIGRARPHSEKSLGTPDPGAISLALAVDAIARVLNTRTGKVNQ